MSPRCSNTAELHWSMLFRILRVLLLLLVAIAAAVTLISIRWMFSLAGVSLDPSVPLRHGSAIVDPYDFPVPDDVVWRQGFEHPCGDIT